MPIIHARFQGLVRTRGDFLVAGIAMDEDMLVAASTHKSPFDACRLRCDVCDSIRRIDKPRLQFIELYKEKEAKPFKWTASSDRRVAAR